jgi:hypothetical protein
MSAGEGGRSRIYKTTTAGQRWTLQYTSERPGFFLDAVAFWDARRGVAMSDPVDNRFVVLTTSDGGATWTPVAADRMPPAVEGRGGVRRRRRGARGAGPTTGLVRDRRQGRARLHLHRPRAELDRHPGAARQRGAVAGGVRARFRQRGAWGAVGGDYAAPRVSRANVAITRDGGAHVEPADGAPARRLPLGLALVPGSRGLTLVAVGTSGPIGPRTVGASWEPIDTLGFNAVSFAAPTAGWAVGADGRIARYVPPRATRARRRAGRGGEANTLGRSADVLGSRLTAVSSGRLGGLRRRAPRATSRGTHHHHGAESSALIAHSPQPPLPSRPAALRAPTLRPARAAEPVLFIAFCIGSPLPPIAGSARSPPAAAARPRPRSSAAT